jgi:CRISPR-associated protein Cmr1
MEVKMKPIEFVVQTVTPMFMAGADGEHIEIRPPSLKGDLRFWWRAYYWGQKTNALTIDEIRTEEGKIFGTTENGGRKSKFALKISHQRLKPTTGKFPKHDIQVFSRGRSFPINILEYLAYGTYEYQRGRGNVFTREYLTPGQEMTVTMLPRQGVDENEIVKSFYFLVMCGGLGAKSRNGFGSLAVKNPEVFKRYGLPGSFPDEQFFTQNLSTNHHVPPFTAFSKGMRVFKLRPPKNSHEKYPRWKTWDDCLAELGRIYRESRGKLEPKHQYEQRQYIAAPIIVAKKQQSRLDRHAKPYFMRVIQKKHDDYEGYIIYLPSTYCDELEKDHFKKPIDHHKVDREFQIACDKFNRLLEYQMEVIV